MEITEDTPDIHEPVKFKVTPERIGRHHDVAPFEVSLGSHVSPTSDMLADRIAREAKKVLLSKEFAVRVDLAKGAFSIQGGRFGKGTFEVMS